MRTHALFCTLPPQERPQKLMKDPIRQLFVKEWGCESVSDHPELKHMFTDRWPDGQLEDVESFLNAKAAHVQW